MFHVKHLEDSEMGIVSRETFPNPYFLGNRHENRHPGQENRGCKMSPLA
jgi:hypothetical protein